MIRNVSEREKLIWRCVTSAHVQGVGGVWWSGVGGVVKNCEYSRTKKCFILLELDASDVRRS